MLLLYPDEGQAYLVLATRTLKKWRKVMDNFDEYEKITTDIKGPLSNISFRLSPRGLALAVSALALVAISGLFLINYPLETIIVGLFIGSIYSMRRG